MVCMHNAILFSSKENWTMTYVGKWMEPENLLLSKATQTQKTKHYHMLSYLSWFQILRSECTAWSNGRSWAHNLVCGVMSAHRSSDEALDLALLNKVEIIIKHGKRAGRLWLKSDVFGCQINTSVDLWWLIIVINLRGYRITEETCVWGAILIPWAALFPGHQLLTTEIQNTSWPPPTIDPAFRVCAMRPSASHSCLQDSAARVDCDHSKRVHHFFKLPLSGQVIRETSKASKTTSKWGMSDC